MTFNDDIIKELRKYDRKFSKANVEQLNKGYEISLTITEVERPEYRLEFDELHALSTYYAYQNIVTAKKLNEEDLDESYWHFSEEELAEDKE
jgi:hypothetical protein